MIARPVLLVGLLAATAPSQVTPLFDTVVDAAGGDPTAVALAEFNGDGLLDRAVADGSTSVVRFQTGNGDGSFSFAGGTPVTSQALCVAFGDLDGSGGIDLVAGDSSGRLHPLLGDGAGGFTPAGSLFSTPPGGAPPDPIDIAVVDLDGDGDGDLAVANQTANLASFLLGDGAGGFAAPTAIGLPGVLLRTITTGDFDGDGDLDAVAGGLGTQMHLLTNDGSGAFSNAGGLGVFGWKVRAADLDGDGEQDLAVAGGVTDAAEVLLGNGDGTFGPVTLYPAGFEPLSLVVADVNGDGADDLALPSSDGAHLALLLNDGSGAFAGGTTAWPVAGLAFGIDAGDVDNDGRVDLVTADASGQGTTQLNLGPGPFTDEGPTSSLAASDGVVAVLTATGDLAPLAAGVISLAFADSATSSTLVIGSTALNAPFKGGVLVPFPEVLLSLPLSAVGSSSVPYVWPAGIPAGFPFWMQHWFQDAGNPGGFAASNALRGVTG